METGKNYPPSLPQISGSQIQQPPFYPTELPETDEDELDLGEILGIVRRRAILIFGITTAVTAAVLTWTMNQTPEYAASFQLLVEPVTGGNRMSGLAAVSQSLGLGGGGGGALDYESQLAVLQSPKIMAPIIQQIQSRYPDIDYKQLFGGVGQKGKLGMDRIKKTKVIQISYQDKDKDKILFILNQLSQGYLKYSLDDRKTDSRQGIQFIDEQLPQLRQRVDTLQAQLQQFRQEYNLIDPQVQGQQLAQQVVTLQNQSLETQTALAQQQLLYQNLQKRLNGLNPDSALVASALTQAPRYQQLLTKLREIETVIATEKARFTENSPSIQALREQQQNLLPLIQREAQQVLGANVAAAVPPQALESPPFQDSIRLQLAQQLVDTANQIEVTKIRNQGINEAQTYFNQKVKEFPVIVRQFTDLQRELGVATNTLNQLLGQREALRVDAAKQDIPWEVISEPKIPVNKEGKPIPAYPQIPKRIAIGVLGGLLLGLGAAFLLEKIKNVFHSPEDVKKITRLPLLGVIPVSDRARQLPQSLPTVDASQNSQFVYISDSPFVEAFRSLNVNLRLLNSERPIRSLVISSPAPADGKSTVAANLAQAAAAMGQRVLLIDADLRWPQIHNKLGLQANPGLSELLTTDLTEASVIQQSRIEENLFVITAGSIPMDSLRLLSCKKMQSLIQQWRNAYDLIIYDSPPLLGLADSSLLAGHTDGILLVVGIGYTDRAELKVALDSLQTAGTPVLGMVANQVKDYAINSYSERPPLAPPAPPPNPDRDAVPM